MRIAVLDFALRSKRAVFFQELDDQRIGFPDGLADQFFGQRAGRAFGLKDTAGGIDRAVDRKAVALADDEVFLAMAGRRVDRAGALLERDVIAQDAERIAVEKRMAEDCALRACARESRDDCVSIPAERFRYLRSKPSATM